VKAINTALLSFGLSGKAFHAPFLHAHPGFRLAGSWERSTKAIQQRYPEAKSFDSFEQLLEDPDVDLVIVNTPTSTHYENTRRALEHGKHVLTEKAFTTNATEAMELESLAKEKKLKLCVFQNRRWDSDFRSVSRVLQEGMLGDIVEANLAFLRYNPDLSPKSHKEEPGPGAGIVKDLGPHVIDQALVLFGMPDALFADIAITRERSRVDDNFDILFIYSDKRIRLKGGYLYKQPLPEYSLFGRRGSFLKTRSDVQEMQLLQGMTPDDPTYGVEPDSAAGRLYTDDGGNALVQDVISPRGNYMDFFEGLYRSIAHGETEPVTASDGIRVMKIIDAAFRSSDQDKVVGL
jgi:predicted dehydrogenase